MFKITRPPKPPLWKRALAKMAFLGIGGAILFSAAMQSGLNDVVAAKGEAVLTGLFAINDMMIRAEKEARGSERRAREMMAGAPCAKKKDGETEAQAAVRCVEEIISMGERELEAKKNKERP